MWIFRFRAPNVFPSAPNFGGVSTDSLQNNLNYFHKNSGKSRFFFLNKKTGYFFLHLFCGSFLFFAKRNQTKSDFPTYCYKKSCIILLIYLLSVINTESCKRTGGSFGDFLCVKYPYFLRYE